MRSEKCETCYFFEAGPKEWGKCLRYPPIVVSWTDQQGATSPRSTWPLVKKIERCGEYQEPMRE